mmetsp:Transcript_8578/g.26965  ORF Transcript_8578/g.26965 Transcript_8578/m.26965 type:complete len:223 (-) Transcript_8578:91-759(-)
MGSLRTTASPPLATCVTSFSSSSSSSAPARPSRRGGISPRDRSSLRTVDSTTGTDASRSTHISAPVASCSVSSASISPSDEDPARARISAGSRGLAPPKTSSTGSSSIVLLPGVEGSRSAASIGSSASRAVRSLRTRVVASVYSASRLLARERTMCMICRNSLKSTRPSGLVSTILTMKYTSPLVASKPSSLSALASSSGSSDPLLSLSAESNTSLALLISS